MLTMDQHLIRLSNVTKVYQMGELQVSALAGLSLEMQAGELVVLLGPSGSGKTTLLNLIGGLDNPTSGTIEVNGEEIQNYTRKNLTSYRKRTIGYIFQFYNLIPNLTAVENVEFSVELVGVANPEMEGRTFDKKIIRSHSENLLRQVGLGDRKDHFPAQLSGGEQQRVAVARALAKNPPLIIADEPTGNLDYKSAQAVLKVMQSVVRDQGKTMVLVTHNTAIARMADRVVQLRDGQIIEDYYNNPPILIDEVVW